MGRGVVGKWVILKGNHGWLSTGVVVAQVSAAGQYAVLHENGKQRVVDFEELDRGFVDIQLYETREERDRDLAPLRTAERKASSFKAVSDTWEKLI